MNFRNVLAILAFSGIVMSNALAQQKIGYVNLPVVLANMSETESMEQTLQTYQKKYAEALRSKEELFQQKYQEFAERAERENLTEAQVKPMQEELQKLGEEVQKYATESENKLVLKRQELMGPIAEKVQSKITELATEKGYTYVLNAMDGAGTSVILNGPDGDNITSALMAKLGIKLPEGQ
ncbi:MAG: OmpH family outer membrane protein [Bacteroidota bacterium]